MGLAASQVRMLSLTTRKAYLQKDLLQNSHRKIALSREMSKLSDKYYDALSQERIMYLSDSGEYKNLSYSFLMGKVGGVEDIDVKDDTSLLLLNTKDGKVILSHDMANAIHFSKDALASDPNNIYLAIARLCSDTNITTPENSDLTFIISPELVKDICAGKYDTFDETDLTKAINNKKYQLYTVNVNDEMEPTNNFEDLGIYITDGFVNSINENTLYKVDIPAGMELTGNQTDDKYVVDAIVRNIAAEYFHADGMDYRNLSLTEKLAVGKALDSETLTTIKYCGNTAVYEVPRTKIAYETDVNGEKSLYLDTRVLMNAINIAYEDCAAREIQTSGTLDQYLSNQSNCWPSMSAVVYDNGIYAQSVGGESAEDYSMPKLYIASSDSANGNKLVQLGFGYFDAEDTNIANTMARAFATLYKNDNATHNTQYSDVLSYMGSFENDFYDYVESGSLYGENWESIDPNIQDLENLDNGTIDIRATFEDPTINEDLIQYLYPELDTTNDIDRLKIYYLKNTADYDNDPSHNEYDIVAYGDASALFNAYYAIALGNNVGYTGKYVGNDPNGPSSTFEFLCPNAVNSTTTGKNTPFLNDVNMRKLIQFKNYNLFAGADFTGDLVLNATVLESGVNFCPKGENTNQWIQNFRDLINDVKFYYPIVTACAKFGYTDSLDPNLNNSEYLDKNIQNGIIQLMSFETDVFSLNSNKDTGYYLVASELAKMNDPSQQASITHWYERERAEITEKETELDKMIENITTEMNSITAEMDSIKSFINDSVKRHFDWGKK